MVSILSFFSAFLAASNFDLKTDLIAEILGKAL
jgi:hypothetical protein